MVVFDITRDTIDREPTELCISCSTFQEYIISYMRMDIHNYMYSALRKCYLALVMKLSLYEVTTFIVFTLRVIKRKFCVNYTTSFFDLFYFAVSFSANSLKTSL